ncbi:hypothetical protein BpHYR1_016895 [Brachionus plicatilis]|uniref:Uncharacterized protein n=1 Tax=Brachionus plicatilis TaxID=10195 RepID=A0A3M7RG16_BRAPC|nr:hypothetical protein BpHYR1_016895 [Brachionus plicatilis]
MVSSLNLNEQMNIINYRKKFVFSIKLSFLLIFIGIKVYLKLFTCCHIKNYFIEALWKFWLFENVILQNSLSLETK